MEWRPTYFNAELIVDGEMSPSGPGAAKMTQSVDPPRRLMTRESCVVINGLIVACAGSWPVTAATNPCEALTTLFWL
jgi:hypothetical protein